MLSCENYQIFLDQKIRSSPLPVYRCYDKQNNIEMSVLRMSIVTNKQEQLLQTLKNSIKSLNDKPHQNILSLHGFYCESQVYQDNPEYTVLDVNVILENTQKTLYHELKNKKQINEYYTTDEFIKLCVLLINIFEYASYLKLIKLNITTKDIFILNNNLYKVLPYIDIGLQTEEEEQEYTEQEDNYEFIEDNRKQYVCILGYILLEIGTLMTTEQISQNKIEAINKIKVMYGQQIGDILELCIHNNPKSRPIFRNLLQKLFLASKMQNENSIIQKNSQQQQQQEQYLEERPSQETTAVGGSSSIKQTFDYSIHRYTDNSYNQRSPLKFNKFLSPPKRLLNFNQANIKVIGSLIIYLDKLYITESEDYEIYSGSEEYYNEDIYVIIFPKSNIKNTSDLELSTYIWEDATRIAISIKMHHINELIAVKSSLSNYYIEQQQWETTLESYTTINNSQQTHEIILHILQGLRILFFCKGIHTSISTHIIVKSKGIWKLSNMIHCQYKEQTKNLLIPKIHSTHYIFKHPDILQAHLHSTQLPIYHEYYDLFSVGVIYYKLTYGSYPWTYNSLDELINNMKKSEIPTPHTPNIHLSTTHIIQKLIKADLPTINLLDNIIDELKAIHI